MGSIELMKGNYQKASFYYLEYAKLVDEGQRTSVEEIEQKEIKSLFNLGQVFFRLGIYQKSLHFYQRAQDLLIELASSESPSNKKISAALQRQEAIHNSEWNPYLLDCLK